MKVLSYLTLAALLSVSACSHHKKSCCSGSAEKMSCTKEEGKKACSDKEKNCADGSCTKEQNACAGDSCQKKS